LTRRENERGFTPRANPEDRSRGFLSLDDLRARKDDVLTYSPRIIEMFGVGSVAEAAALAARGKAAFCWRRVSPRPGSPAPLHARARETSGNDRAFHRRRPGRRRSF